MRLSKIKLRTYTGEELEVCGAIPLRVSYQEKEKNLDLIVVKGTGPSLMGRDWLNEIRLDWWSLNRLETQTSTTLQKLLEKHAEVFKEKLGRVNDALAKIHVDANARPRFCRPRPVPYALRSKIDQEIDRLEHVGIIEKVQVSDWAAPVVPVVKLDGSIRLCGDYKITVNQAIKMDTHPLPKIEELFASLAHGKTFSKLDLAQAYLQVPL